MKPGQFGRVRRRYAAQGCKRRTFFTDLRLPSSRQLPCKRDFETASTTSINNLNLSALETVLHGVANVLQEGDAVVLRSTVKVGTTRAIAKRVLDTTGKTYCLAFCPERTIEGKALRELTSLPQIVGGIDDQSIDRATSIFSVFAPRIVRVDSIEAAEMVMAHKKYGFSGIPQDTRLLFDRLGLSDDLLVDGLLWSNAGSWHGGVPKRIEEQAVFLGIHLDKPQPHWMSRAAGRIHTRLGGALESLVLGRKSRYDLYDLDNRQLKEIVWRDFLASTVEPQQRTKLLDRNYKMSAMGWWAVNAAAIYNLKASIFNTDGYDFAIFQDARKVSVSNSTQKVIRYHDGIPVLAIDTIKDGYYAHLHAKSIRACEKDSLYVCNSPSAVDDLKNISPYAAERATVIPYFVPPMTRLETTRQQLEDIAVTRISSSTLPDGKGAAKQQIIETWFSAARDKNAIPPYIMTLSTIEPRKNIPALISAWQQLRERQRDLRLLIVGKPGWEFTNTLSAMKPFVEQGLILHLEGIAQRELRYLYSAASCFVFPSFAEGFGLPPVEAMQSGCPVVVSDIPAHRYMAGDAALFIDPYDRNDIAEKISKVLTTDIAADLRERGYRNAERFTVEAVLPQWEAFFEKHRKKAQ